MRCSEPLRASWHSASAAAFPPTMQVPRRPTQSLSLGGQCLVTDLGFQWVMVSDDSGIDYCVRHPSDWQSFPFDFVAKRIHEQEPHGGFFRTLYDLLNKREVA